MASGEREGFGVTLVDAFRDENAAVISSSFIRSLLAEGDVSHAAGLLGYRYTVEAEVIDGKKLGRTLGYPTANMRLPPEAELKSGIYAVRFRRADGSLHDGVASFGRRPTVDSDGRSLWRPFVFDFSADPYGEICAVSFSAGCARTQVRRSGALMSPMRKDESEARAACGRSCPERDRPPAQISPERRQALRHPMRQRFRACAAGGLFKRRKTP